MLFVMFVHLPALAGAMVESYTSMYNKARPIEKAC